MFEHSTHQDKSQEHDGLNTVGKSKTSNGLWLILTFKIRALRNQWINGSHLGHATISIWEKWQTQRYIHGCHCYCVCVWMITESRLKAPSTDTYLWLIWIYTEPFLSGRRETWEKKERCKRYLTLMPNANLWDQWVFLISIPSDTVRTCVSEWLQALRGGSRL